jgi:hypothetical protein
VAAQLGDRYLNALQKFETIVAENVARNLFERHLKRVFIDS